MMMSGLEYQTNVKVWDTIAATMKMGSVVRSMHKEQTRGSLSKLKTWGSLSKLSAHQLERGISEEFVLDSTRSVYNPGHV